jgi:medium-chain acyl-[acyl-carrier-protein] hydrolase
MDSRWLVPLGIPANPTSHLLCFPQAGGGAMTFRPWAKPLGAGVAVWGARFPGRETRLDEPPCVDLEEAIEELAAAAERLPPGPFSCFGHCGGALIAYELSYRLLTWGARSPRSLIVSGQVSPRTLTVEDPVHDLPMPQLIEYLRSTGGTPPDLLAHDRLMELLAPALRADLRLAHDYTCDQSRPSLGVPIVVFGGRHDDVVALDHLFDWYRFTDRQFSLHLLPGDHWLLAHQRANVLEVISAHISQLDADVSGAVQDT